MRFLEHMYLIFWKNVFITQMKRHYMMTTIEIVVPVILAYFFLYGGVVSHKHTFEPITQLPDTTTPTPPASRLYLQDRIQLLLDARSDFIFGVNVFYPRFPQYHNFTQDEIATYTTTNKGLIMETKSKRKKKKKKRQLTEEERIELLNLNIPRYTESPVKHMLGALPVVLGFCFLLPPFVKRLTDELSSGTKELLSINGLNETAYWVGNFLGVFIEMVLVALPVMTLYFFDPIGSATPLWKHTDLSLLFVVFFLYAASNCTLSLNVGIISPNRHGMTWSIFRSHHSILRLTIEKICFCMIISSVVQLIMAWYLKNVWPLGYTFPKPWWFLFMPNYWGVWRKIHISPDQAKRIREDPLLFEPVADNLEPSIIIYRLCKTMGPIFCEFSILHEVTFKIFQGHITAVLGRNGAGKSTLLRTLVGSIKPSSGTAFIENMDVRRAKTAVRRMIGYCPQHFALYRELTALENMWFVGKVRGIHETVLMDQIDILSRTFGVNEFENVYVKRMTAAQKRRLQMAIALLGDPKLLLLDEPSVGCDTDTRNAMWHAILKIRAQRGILLATNCIDEADILGDRVAIISNGSVRCCGSTLFLRRKYGIGYRLHMTLMENSRIQDLSGFVQARVEQARVYFERSRFVVFSLTSPPKDVLAALLKDLEKNRIKLGIFGIGLAATSLEDVLLKVDEEDEDIAERESDDLDDDVRAAHHVDKFQGKLERDRPDPNYKREFIPLSGMKLLQNQFMALLFKKMSYFRRSYISIPFMLLCVLLATCIRHFIFIFVTLSLNDIKPTPANDSENTIQQQILHNSLFAKQIEALRRTSKRWNYRDLLILQYDVEKFKKTIKGEYYTMMLSLRSIDSLVTTVVLSILAASFAVLPIQESITKAKLIQLMTGISAPRYWIITFLLDLLCHAIGSAIILFTYFVINPLGVSRAFDVLITYFHLFVAFGCALIPSAYMSSFYVESPATAYFTIVVTGFLAGTMLSIGEFFLVPSEITGFIEVTQTDQFLSGLFSVFNLVPNFSLSRALAVLNRYLQTQVACCTFPTEFANFLWDIPDSKSDNMHITEADRDFWKKIAQTCPNISEIVYNQRHNINECPVSYDGLKSADLYFYVYFMSFIGALTLVGIMIWDTKTAAKIQADELLSREELKKKLRRRHDEGAEEAMVQVARERVQDLIEAMEMGQESGFLGLIVHKLGKVYNGVQVIDSVSFHVEPGQTFGILGRQQSGRSTVLAICAGDRDMGRGNCFIEGWVLRRNPVEYMKRVGYCPEEDPLIDKLTGREHLNLIARLRGLPADIVSKEVRFIMDRVGLFRLARRTTSDYSSGSRRKLTMGMSLVGDPPVVILDECTQGVDPISRGRLFRAVTRIQRLNGMAVLFTSHCMRECDILCSHVGIIRDGEFQAIGETVELKLSSEQSCTIVIKLTLAQAKTPEFMKKIIREMRKVFPNAAISEKREDQIRYKWKESEGQYQLIWSEVVTKLIKLQQQEQFEDFIVNDVSLGEIYIGFARERKMVDFGDDNIRYFDKDEPPTAVVVQPAAGPTAPSTLGQLAIAMSPTSGAASTANVPPPTA